MVYPNLIIPPFEYFGVARSIELGCNIGHIAANDFYILA